MESICKNCKFWNKNEHERTLDLGKCKRAKLLWDVTEWSEDLDENSGGEYSRVLKQEFKDEKHFVNDGSDYHAILLTKEDFGCNQFEILEIAQ